MQEQATQKRSRVCGYEANGGFLLGSDIDEGGRALSALPTRDAVLPIVAVLAAARPGRVAEAVAALPPRVTFSERIANFPTADSAALLAWLSQGDGGQATRAADPIFRGAGRRGAKHRSHRWAARDLRRRRPSSICGPRANAPELRCYTEASQAARAQLLNAEALDGGSRRAAARPARPMPGPRFRNISLASGVSLQSPMGRGGTTLDITQLILDDHHEQRRLFAILEQIPDDNLAALKAVWFRLSTFLEAHARAEEKFFYPQFLQVGRAKGIADKAESETEDAIKDHNEIRDAIAEVAKTEIGSAAWRKAVAGANKANGDHMAEEEREGLTHFRQKASLAERQDLAVSFITFETQHLEGVTAVNPDPEQWVKEHG